MEPSVRKTILLVEDQAIIAMQERRQLETAGYSVIHVLSGEKAIEEMDAGPESFDLILMDIDLGQGMDGTQTAQAILGNHDLPILFLSSHMEPGIVALTEKITNYGYVVKSSSFTVLDASIKMAFKLFEANRRINEKNREIEAANEELRLTIGKLETANARLSHSEEKFSRTFYLSPDSINLNRLSDGVYLEINDGFTKIMGYSAADVIGRSSLPGNVGVWIHAEDRARLVDGLKADGEVLNLEAEFRHKDGSIKIGMMSARLIEINGEICILSITRDITDRRLIENSLRESELKFRTAFEKAPVGISLTDMDGRLRMVNRAFCEMMGRTEQELRDIGYSHFTHPDDMAISLEKRIMMAEGTVDDVRFPKRYIHKDGHDIWADVSISLVRTEQGQPDYFIAHILDISERIKAEASLGRTQVLLRSSVDSLKHMVMLTIDRKFDYLYFNRSYRDTILNRYGIDIKVGMNLRECIPADEFFRDSMQYYERAFAGESSKVIERYDREGICYESSYNPVFDDAGLIIGATAFASDITERIRYEDEIRRLLGERS